MSTIMELLCARWRPRLTPGFTIHQTSHMTGYDQAFVCTTLRFDHRERGVVVQSQQQTIYLRPLAPGRIYDIQVFDLADPQVVQQLEAALVRLRCLQPEDPTHVAGLGIAGGTAAALG